jgi:hypothetical protein
MVHFNERAVGGVFHPPASDVARALSGGPTAIIFDGRSVWISLYHSGVRRLADFADLDKAGFDSYQEADGLSSDGVRALFQDRRRKRVGGSYLRLSVGSTMTRLPKMCASSE